MRECVFKLMKSVSLALFIVITIINVAEAKEVTVDGVGTDRDSALKDARRNAIEQVIGTFVDSRTLVNNAVVEMDQIYLKSAGFVGKVDILSESTDNGLYKVRATINVDESPNSELLKQVQAVMALNDPKIAVSVVRGDTGTHEIAIESAIIDKLVSMNFSHVVDTANTSRGITPDAEFMVMATTSTSSKGIKIPDFKGGYIDTGLDNGQTELTAKIIRLDTGDILETFTIETSGIGEGSTTAEREALKNMANQAAEKVDEKFRRIGAKQQ